MIDMPDLVKKLVNSAFGSSEEVVKLNATFLYAYYRGWAFHTSYSGIGIAKIIMVDGEEREHRSDWTLNMPLDVLCGAYTFGTLYGEAKACVRRTVEKIIEALCDSGDVAINTPGLHTHLSGYLTLFPLKWQHPTDAHNIGIMIDNDIKGLFKTDLDVFNDYSEGTTAEPVPRHTQTGAKAILKEISAVMLDKSLDPQDKVTMITPQIEMTILSPESDYFPSLIKQLDDHQKTPPKSAEYLEDAGEAQYIAQEQALATMGTVGKKTDNIHRVNINAVYVSHFPPLECLLVPAGGATDLDSMMLLEGIEHAEGGAYILVGKTLLSDLEQNCGGRATPVFLRIRKDPVFNGYSLMSFKALCPSAEEITCLTAFGLTETKDYCYSIHCEVPDELIASTYAAFMYASGLKFSQMLASLYGVYINV